jgi:hypothetical protein
VSLAIVIVAESTGAISFRVRLNDGINVLLCRLVEGGFGAMLKLWRRIRRSRREVLDMVLEFF